MEPSQPPADGPPPPQPAIPSPAPAAPSVQVQQVGTQPPAGQGGAVVQVVPAPTIARAGAPTSAAPAFVISNTGQLIAAKPAQALPPGAVRPVAAAAAAPNSAAALAAAAAAVAAAAPYIAGAPTTARSPSAVLAAPLARPPPQMMPGQLTYANQAAAAARAAMPHPGVSLPQVGTTPGYQFPHQWPHAGAGPHLAAPQVAPKVFMSTAPPFQVSIVLKADNGIREAGSLVLDKRTVCLQVTVLDAAGERTRTALGLQAQLTPATLPFSPPHSPIPTLRPPALPARPHPAGLISPKGLFLHLHPVRIVWQVVLVYEDLSEMAPGVQLAALTGKTDVTCKDGGAQLKLRITTVSSAHSKRRFRFKVAPMDVTLAAERPRLIQLSEAFSVVSHTQTVSKHHPVGPRAAGPANARAANAAGAAPSGSMARRRSRATATSRRRSCAALPRHCRRATGRRSHARRLG